LIQMIFISPIQKSGVKSNSIRLLRDAFFVNRKV